MAEIIILLADSRHDVRHELTDLLQSQDPDLRIVTAESGANALEKLPLRPFRVLLTAPQLPDMSGLHLIEQARARRPDLGVIVLADPGQTEIRELYDRMRIPCVDRQSDLEVLLFRIRSFAAPAETGRKTGIEGLSLEKAVERLCLANETAQIRVVSNEGLGAVNIEQGQMIHAHAKDTQGEEAYRTMLKWKDASLELAHIVRSDVKSIYKPWQNVLHDAAERIRQETDQAKRKTAPHPSKPVVKQTPNATVGTSAGSANIWLDRRRIAPRPKHDHLRPRGVFVFLLLLTGLITGALFVFKYPNTAAQVIPWLLDKKETSTQKSKPKAQIRHPLSVKKFIVPPDIQTGRWEMCKVRAVSHPEFAESGNTILLDGPIFDTLDLGDGPWVELIGPRDSRIGAFAVRVATTSDDKVVQLREAMIRSLDLDPEYAMEILVRSVTWPMSDARPKKLTFGRVRLLPTNYSENWFAAGLSLSMMQSQGLHPGDYAIVKGPKGFQSVTIQLMDRGNPHEIWLSKSVRDVVGISSPRDRVTLHPKSPSETR